MKYGDTLRQRSIPEWGHYNIDYDYLKDLIKHHTTPGAGTALSIPGQGATTERAFADAFFKVLKGQHDRINLFVKSKSGEVERRLDYIGKQLAKLQARRPAAPSAPWAARTVEKYAKIDADIARAGEEIRSLSRFQTAQRTGFQKILKKYKRWTHDRDLERRFKEDVITNQDSFFRLDLGYLLDHYIGVLGALRETLDQSGAPINPNRPSSASKLYKATQEGSEVDFDLALTTIPFGPYGSRAAYWIHPDHTVEVLLLLLQHMRLYAKTGPSPAPEDSTQVTPALTSSKAIDRYFSEDDVGLVVLDNPAEFARKQNASTVDAEDIPGTVPVKAAGNVRWASSDAAVVVGLDTVQPNEEQPNSVRVARVERGQLEDFLNCSTTASLHGDLTPTPCPNSDNGSFQNDKEAVQNWLSIHGDIRPLASICSKRTRFVGLHNTPLGGTWASLDSEIFMKASLHKNLSSDKLSSAAEPEAASFPHAVLEIRREGAQSAGLIHVLDRSHLVERVPGFLLETQAVWVCSRPSSMSAPTWLPLLSQDIRKLPAPVKRQRRSVPSASDSASHVSLSQASTTATSPASPFPSHNGDTSPSESIDPPPLRAFRKKRSPYFKDRSPVRSVPTWNQSYWNEYDNPESEDEGYYLYVDPNASIKVPGQEILEPWVRKIKEFLGMGNLQEESQLSTTENGSSDEESGSGYGNACSRNYGTISSVDVGRQHGGYFGRFIRSLHDRGGGGGSTRQGSESERQRLLAQIHVRQREREMITFLLYASSLGAAAVLDIILAILTTTSRRKSKGEVDIAIVLGVICNLVLLLVAITSMVSRRERLGWLHQGVVFAFVLAMVVVDALLFRWALSL